MADAFWRILACPRCGGHGVIAVYSAYDFEGPGECRDCDGSGRLWIRPSDRLFAYPGGGARGSWPGAYATATPMDLRAS